MTIILGHHDVCGISIETKLKMLMIMLHRVNHLNIRQKNRKNSRKPLQPVNEGDVGRPERPPVPSVDVKLTIQLEYLRNL